MQRSLDSESSENPPERTYTTKHGSKAAMDTSGQKKVASRKKAAAKAAPVAESKPAAAPSAPPEVADDAPVRQVAKGMARDHERFEVATVPAGLHLRRIG